MPEPLTTQLIASELERLLVVLPRGKSAVPVQRLAEEYRNSLGGVSGDAFRWAVKTAIREDQYFPKVARLRDLASRWMTANRTTLELQIPRPLGWCDGCQSTARPQQRWRPKITDKGLRILDAAGRLQLEEYERIVCKCDAPSRYYPDDPTTDCMTESRKPAA